MENFQTNKQTKTLKHKMTFKDVSFILVLNSSHYYTIFTLKTTGGSGVIKLKGLRITDALEWLARFDKGIGRVV